MCNLKSLNFPNLYSPIHFNRINVKCYFQSGLFYKKIKIFINLSAHREFSIWKDNLLPFYPPIPRHFNSCQEASIVVDCISLKTQKKNFFDKFNDIFYIPSLKFVGCVDCRVELSRKLEYVLFITVIKKFLYPIFTYVIFKEIKMTRSYINYTKRWFS